MDEGARSLALGELEARVRVLAPEHAPTGLAAYLDASRTLGGEPFSRRRCEIVGALSARFLKDPELRRDPASVALGYWMRPSAIALLQAAFERRQAAEPSLVRVPAGRVFHVAPSNVDTLFVYSWVLSFLCGNADVVRVSQQPNAIVRAMLRAITAEADEHPELSASTRFVTYEHDDQVDRRALTMVHSSDPVGRQRDHRGATSVAPESSRQ